LPLHLRSDSIQADPIGGSGPAESCVVYKRDRQKARPDPILHMGPACRVLAWRGRRDRRQLDRRSDPASGLPASSQSPHRAGASIHRRWAKVSPRPISKIHGLEFFALKPPVRPIHAPEGGPAEEGTRRQAPLRAIVARSTAWDRVGSPHRVLIVQAIGAAASADARSSDRAAGCSGRRCGFHRMSTFFTLSTGMASRQIPAKPQRAA
jgi:hypothetical protein